MAKGVMTSDAMNNREAAITKEGASFCATLINIDAVDTAMIPKKRPIIG